MQKSALKWELIGIAIISVLGTFFHFLFDLSGQWPPIGVIAAVNESVFEHLKLTYWPTLIYAAITYGILRNSSNNFIIAKTAGVYVMPISILVFFYAYTTIAGIENFIIDILIFIIAVALGQFASYKILKAKKLANSFRWLAMMFLIVLGIAYVVFTFYPPQLPVFLDANIGTYGIP